MLLFDSLHMASNALNVSQLGIQVAGQNLNNAQTAGYVREQLVLQTGTSRDLGNGVVVGTGVSVQTVKQVIDEFLEERLRTATSDAVSSAMRQKYYTELEALINETTDLDLSTSLEDFFNSIDNVVNHPENVTYREMTVEQGKKLAEDIQRLATTISEKQADINTSIATTADEINRLLTEIQELNRSIAMLESKPGQEALGLRDQRLGALSALSQLINIKTTEDETGQVTIYCGSDILLMNDFRNEVYVGSRETETGTMSQLCIRDTKSPLDVRSGAVYGLYESFETILGGYARQLDEFAATLISQFNILYSSGQGMTGYTELTSLAQVSDPDEPLSLADLDFSIQNGIFKIQVYDTNTNVTTDYEIKVEVAEAQPLNPFSLEPAPLTTGTTLEDIARQIDAIDGLSATVNMYGQLEIRSDHPDTQFAFAQDESGFLAAMGINTFFTGSGAGTIAVNQTVLDDPGKFAASLGGVGHDAENALTLAALGIAPNPALGGRSVIDYYGSIVSGTMLAAGTMRSIASSDALYQASLQAQRDSISGVNIDEETIQMMTYQRMFQANSRFVTIINEMLETLILM